MSKKRNPPDLKSVAKAKEKANKYVTSDETSKMVKQAILRELNSHLLSVRPQTIHEKAPKEGREGNKKLAVGTTSRNPYRDQSVRRRAVNGKDEGAKVFAERHGHVSSMISRIPRPSVSNKQPQNLPKATKSERGEKAKRTPGYDWDKNGRMAELKIRFIARKHAAFWMKNVYGRVTPSQARKHYERKLKKDSFTQLEDLWWNSRKGWKLNIRAEYHDRCRIWKRCLRGWKIFLMQEKEKKLKTKMVERFDDRRIMKNCFQSIKEYCEVRKERRKEKHKADQFRRFCSNRYVFHQWTETLSNARISRSLENQALSFWAVNLKFKALAKWKLTKHLKDIENEKIIVAEKHYQAQLTRRYFAVLLSYISYRRKKRYTENFAINHFQTNLKKKTIDYWYIHLQRRLQIYELEDRIEFMARKFTLRSYVVRWRLYINDVHEERGKTLIGVKHCNRKIKVKYFEVLRTAARRRRQKIDRLEKAITFRKTKLILMSWNLWLKRCDRSEELKLYPLTKIARNFHRKNILRDCLKQWCYYISWRRKRKMMYAKADVHFERIALPKYFNLLFEYKEIRKVKTERKDIADAFQREFVYAKAFYTWLKQSRINQDVRMLERMAILHNEEVCKRKTLASWRHKTHAVLERTAKEAVADAFRRKSVKVRYLKLLKLNADTENTRRKQEKIAFKHDSMKKLSMTFNAWLQYTQHAKYKKQKKQMADDHYHMKLSCKIFSAFKIYLTQRRKIDEEANRRCEVHERLLLRWTIHRWHENVVELVEEKCKLKKADDFETMKKKREAFVAWREIAALSSYERAKENEKLAEIKNEMDKGKLQRAFSAWQECTKKSNRKKQIQCLANQFHENRIKQRTIVAWKEYMTFSFKKQLLQRQSMIFYTQRSLRKFFERWKIQHSGSIQERNRNNVVIWWWSRNLQRKVFYAWRDFLEVNKKKNALIAKALELRRTWLLENCTQKWFQYSTDMMAFRSKIAHSRQIEGTVKLQELVRKYALLWYSKSKRCKRAERTTGRNAVLCASKGQSQRDMMLKSNVPMILERKSLAVDLPIICKDLRPMPRNPEYLRDSFDLNLLLSNPTDKSCTRTDESKPRSQQPEPHTQTRLQSHPSQRLRADNSIEFGLSSEDDWRAKNKLTKKLIRPGEEPKKFYLMPPSSFKKSTQIQGIEKTNSKVRRKARPQQILLTEEPSSEDIDSDTLSDDVEEEDEKSDDDAIPGNEEIPGTETIYKEVSRIKEELVQFQNEKIRYRELEERHQHLSQWIASESREYIGNTLQLDEDFQQARQLKLEVQLEMEELSEKLASRKPLVTKMARDIQSLLEKLKTR